MVSNQRGREWKMFSSVQARFLKKAVQIKLNLRQRKIAAQIKLTKIHIISIAILVIKQTEETLII